MHIPLAKPEIVESDIAAVAAILRSGRLSQGPALYAFEEALATYLSVAHAVALNSGTSALQLALLALNIGEGDEVILPSFSFMAVTNAVLTARAVPAYAEIDPQTLNLHPAKLDSLLSSRTRAIIVVHTFGHPAEMKEITAFARRHGLLVIEDACEAVGTEVNGRKAGASGDVGILGFYPNKQITTGEGGALVTNSDKIATNVRRLSNQGREPSEQWLQHEEAGYSYRISDISCALGLQQLSRIDDILNRREDIARVYERYLRNVDVRCFGDFAGERISRFTYPILLPRGFRQRERDEIWQKLRQMGIECGRYFPPAHLQPVMRNFPFRCGELSATNEISQRLLCLPFFNSLQKSEIEFVCNSLSEVLQEHVSAVSTQTAS